MKMILVLFLLLISSLVQAAVLNTVGSVTVTTLSGTSLRVDWTDPVTNVGYRVERCTGNAGACNGAVDSSWALVGVTGVNVKTFTDTGLSVGQAYTYRVYEDPFMFITGTPTSSTTTTSTTTSSTASTTTATTTTATTTGTGATTTSTTSPGQNLLGFIPGTGLISDVAADVSNNRVAVASQQFGFSIVNVSNPSAMVAIGSSNIPFTGTRVAIASGVAVVTDQVGNGNLRIIDTSTPTAPLLKLSIVGQFRGAAITTTRAYVTRIVSGNPSTMHLTVYNISSLTNPTQVGDVQLSSNQCVYTVRLSGTNLFLACGTDGMRVVSVSSDTPSEIGSYDTPGTLYDLAITGTSAYLADTTATLVLNIGTPSAPTLTATIAAPASGIAATSTKVVTVDGDVNFRTIDPNTNTIQGTTAGNKASSVAIISNTAFAGEKSTALKGLMAYNVTSLTSPSLTSFLYGILASTGVGGAVNDSTNVGIVTSAANGAGGAYVVDTSTSSLPVKRAFLQDSTRPMVGAAINGQVGYTAEIIPGNPNTSNLTTINLTTPTSPSVIARVTLPGNISGPYNIKYSNSLVYIPTGFAGPKALYIVNVSNPSVPFNAGTFIANDFPLGVDVSGTTAVLGTASELVTINVSNPSNPVQSGILSTTAGSIAISGNKAYTSDTVTLKEVNIADVNNPVQTSSTGARGTKTLAIIGSRLVGVSPTGGHTTIEGAQIWRIDTSPPTFVRQVVLPGGNLAAYAGTNLFFIADNAGILDILSPTP